MKKGIHPTTMETNVVCACGNTFKVTSNKPELHLEVCNMCHPFFTNEQSKSTVKRGKVEKFNRKYGLTDDAK